jgi:2-dehydro-3-deoxyphosphogluconate aldolase/(4S)-4-hydroxy-2-oxoglutarate aldolase
MTCEKNRETKVEKLQMLRIIRETGIIAIIRAQNTNQLIKAAKAIQDGGVHALEVTMTTPDALQVIEDAKKILRDNVLFGAGTVLDSETARQAISVGADFIVSPTLNIEVIALCRRYGVPVIPGCYTPTELLHAWEAGADMLKVFPASIGGPRFIKAILAPLPQLQLIPVGGVNVDSAEAFINAGAIALGIGNNLINQTLLDSNDMEEITKRASSYIKLVKSARK